MRKSLFETFVSIIFLLIGTVYSLTSFMFIGGGIALVVLMKHMPKKFNLRMFKSNAGDVDP